jgi:hypothetical protein
MVSTFSGINLFVPAQGGLSEVESSQQLRPQTSRRDLLLFLLHATN